MRCGAYPEDCSGGQAKKSEGAKVVYQVVVESVSSQAWPPQLEEPGWAHKLAENPPGSNWVR